MSIPVCTVISVDSNGVADPHDLSIWEVRMDTGPAEGDLARRQAIAEWRLEFKRALGGRHGRAWERLGLLRCDIEDVNDAFDLPDVP